jgi:sRNA-binding protein
MKRSPVTPRQAAKKLAEITAARNAAKSARKAARAAKSAARTGSHKAPPPTEHTGKTRRVRQVCYVVLSECELGDKLNGDPVTMDDVAVGGIYDDGQIDDAPERS